MDVVFSASPVRTPTFLVDGDITAANLALDIFDGELIVTGSVRSETRGSIDFTGGSAQGQITIQGDLCGMETPLDPRVIVFGAIKESC